MKEGNSKDNHKSKGTDGPGVKWNPGSIGGYSRGLSKGFAGNVESEKRKGAGQKA